MLTSVPLAIRLRLATDDELAELVQTERGLYQIVLVGLELDRRARLSAHERLAEAQERTRHRKG